MRSSPAIAEPSFADGKRLEAVRVEARYANRPTIVMLHEGLGSVAHWKDFPLRLVEKQVLAFSHSRDVATDHRMH